MELSDALPTDAFANLHVIDHPLIADKLTWLRATSTGRRAFRALVNQIAGLMVYEATRSLDVGPVSVETPLERMEGKRLVGSPTVVPVLRAGLGIRSKERLRH